MTEKTQSSNQHSSSEGAKGVAYRCSLCGVVHSSSNGAPVSCMKCDNTKFYKVKK